MDSSDSLKNHTLEDVIKCYQKFNTGIEQESISDLFVKFLKQDLSPINEWLQNQFSHKVSKNDSLSTKYRQQGNSFYVKKNLKKSLDSYTKSLCYAFPSSEEYSLALANRSAVTFHLEKYEDSLKDINLCLASNYPQHLWPKILVRKAECLQKLGRHNALLDHVQEAFSFFNTVSSKNEDKYIEKLNQLKNSKDEGLTDDETADFMCALPSFEDGENPTFAYASSKIEMRYNFYRGRHVVAKKKISKGDILFLEKAFISCSIFDEDTRDISTERCYHCLKNIFSGIPCRSCVKCVFCDNKCRDKLWEQSHRWECEGMHTNMWFHLGITFPAFRAMLKGIGSCFDKEDMDFIRNKERFGNKTDNYPYFNSLLYHVRGNEIEALICSTIVVKYLILHTGFFPWYLKQPNCPEKDMSTLTKYVGQRLAKHILQFESNSSVIEHWKDAETDLELPTQKIPVACGIFPSVSIMNHSCKPNVTVYCIRDTMVVKALEDIEIDKEVLNCYGIDYRMMEKKERQRHCLSIYNFDCSCVICSDHNKEMDMFDSFICIKCGNIIPDSRCIRFWSCENCGLNIDLKRQREMNKSIGQLLADENNEEALLSCLDRRKMLLRKEHSEIQDTCNKLYQFYIRKGNLENMIKYLEVWLEIETIRVGGNSHKLGSITREIALTIKKYFKDNPSYENKNLYEKADLMLKEAKFVCSMFYPEYIINKLMWN